MRVRAVIGLLLLSVSAASVLQTAQEVYQSYATPWTESSIRDSAFTFAGHAITIIRPPRGTMASPYELVDQERVLIDGVVVGDATGRRMSTWPFSAYQRSPHWFEAVKFINHAATDSSLWIAKRLQQTDSARPRFEIIVFDASGKHTIEMRSLNELGGEYRMRSTMSLIGEDAPTEFPLSAVYGVMFPALVLVFPIGTGVLGVLLLRRSRGKRAPDDLGAGDRAEAERRHVR